MPDVQWFANPKGIASSSPRLPSPRGYLGARVAILFNNPEGVASVFARRAATPLGLMTHCPMLPQGSSCLATLGFEPESRWDSPQSPHRGGILGKLTLLRRFDVHGSSTTELPSLRDSRPDRRAANVVTRQGDRLCRSLIKNHERSGLAARGRPPRKRRIEGTRIQIGNDRC